MVRIKKECGRAHLPGMLRRTHDWRARPHGPGATEWYARDDKESRRLCIIHDGQDGEFQFEALLRRGRVSAFLASCVRGTPLARRLQEREAIIVGSFEGGGRLRACSSREFYEAFNFVRGVAELGISMNPSDSWLGRLRRADGRIVWDLLEDRSMMRLVPPAPLDGTPLAAAISHVLKAVIRSPPIHPLIPPYCYPGAAFRVPGKEPRAGTFRVS
eukprot:gene15926-biopygen12698